MTTPPPQPTDLVILGTSAFAEEVLDLALDCPEVTVHAFIENFDATKVPGPMLELPVVWIDDLKERYPNAKAICSVGSTTRSYYVDQVGDLGYAFATLVHPTCRVSRSSTLGEGTLLSVGTIIASHTRVGRHVIINRSCSIGHHTEIGDCVTISPGSNIGGRVRIGSGSYIGMGATILNDVTVGPGAIVGAGALVNKDVPERTQVLGIPARVTKTEVAPL